MIKKNLKLQKLMLLAAISLAIQSPANASLAPAKQTWGEWFWGSDNGGHNKTSKSSSILKHHEENELTGLTNWSLSKLGIGKLAAAIRKAKSIARKNRPAAEIIPALKNLTPSERSEVINAWFNELKDIAAEKTIPVSEEEIIASQAIKDMLTTVDTALSRIGERLVLVERSDELLGQEDGTIEFEVINDSEYEAITQHGNKYGNVKVYYKPTNISDLAKRAVKSELGETIQENRGNIIQAGAQAVKAGTKQAKNIAQQGARQARRQTAEKGPFRVR